MTNCSCATSPALAQAPNFVVAGLQELASRHQTDAFTYLVRKTRNKHHRLSAANEQALLDAGLIHDTRILQPVTSFIRSALAEQGGADQLIGWFNQWSGCLS